METSKKMARFLGEVRTRQLPRKTVLKKVRKYVADSQIRCDNSFRRFMFMATLYFVFLGWYYVFGLIRQHPNN